MQGRYKVKSAGLKPLHERATKLSRQLGYFALEHVPREMNSAADALANAALDGSATASLEHRVTNANDPTAGGRPPGSQSIRAKFVNGVFVPAEPVELPDGSEVLLDIRVEREK